MAFPRNFDDWQFTKKIIRITHNREVKKYFKDIASDTSRANGRQAIKTSLLIRDNDSAIEILNKQIFFRLGLNDGNVNLDIAPVVPDWWALRAGSNRPQLSLIFKQKNKTKYSHYIINVPHYKGGRLNIPPVKPFDKGNIRGALHLSDNSKVIVYTSTEDEAAKVLGQIRRLIIPRFLSGSTETYGRKKGRKLNQFTAIPVGAKYYPRGQENLEPEWRVRFN